MLLFWVYFIQVIFFLFYFSKESLLWPSVIDQLTSKYLISGRSELNLS